jgi:hypothetical protein
MNTAKTVWFSSHDDENVKGLRTMLVLSSAHDCAHAQVSGHVNTGWTLCEQNERLRSKLSETENRGAKVFLSSCFMLSKLYSPSSVHFLVRDA